MTSLSLVVTVCSISATKRPVVSVPPMLAPPCDESLWKHVYVGDRRRFKKVEDRLKVIDRCKTVTGTIVWANGEDDGDFHLRLRLDPGQGDLLNAKNRQKLPRGQSGNLVVEPICQKTPTQANTVAERVCVRFRQDLPAMAIIKANVKKKKGTKVEVTGAFITDAEHGWNEIHPVTSIRVIQ